MPTVRELLRALGLRRRPPVPFGVDWMRDVAALDVPRVIFDVGAHIGQTATRLHSLFPSAEIHAFEPVPSTFGRLRRNTARIPSVKLVEAAVGDRDGSLRITNVPLSERNSSVVDLAGIHSTLEVASVTIDTYMHSSGLEGIDLLKIDTEGGELAVLAGAEKTISSGAVRMILAECDFHPRPETPHTPFVDLFSVLSSQYRVVSFYCHGVDGDGWIWGDVLFMRPTSHPPQIGSRKRWPPLAIAPRPRS